MDTDPAGGAWLLLLTGAACAAVGFAFRYLPGGLGAFVNVAGGPAPGPRETRWIPRALLFAAFAWAFVWATAVIPFPNGAPPYAVVILSVVLHPLGALALAGAFLWLLLLRRFG